MIPLAYCHLLEVMVTLYVLISPTALVPSLLWVAIPISPIVTLFFYGFFVLGTRMLMDPFQQESGFDTESMLTSNILSMESIERNVPLSFAKRNTHRRSSFPGLGGFIFSGETTTESREPLSCRRRSSDDLGDVID